MCSNSSSTERRTMISCARILCLEHLFWHYLALKYIRVSTKCIKYIKRKQQRTACSGHRSVAWLNAARALNSTSNHAKCSKNYIIYILSNFGSYEHLLPEFCLSTMKYNHPPLAEVAIYLTHSMSVCMRVLYAKHFSGFLLFAFHISIN